MMPFPFSFVFAVPGIANPFGPPDQLHGQAFPQPSNAHIDPSQNGSSNNATKLVKKNLLRRRTPPPPDLEPPQPISKKRRWVPSRPEPSQPKASKTFVRGSKYPEMQSSEAGSDAGADTGEGEFPVPLRSLVRMAWSTTGLHGRLAAAAGPGTAATWWPGEAFARSACHILGPSASGWCWQASVVFLSISGVSSWLYAPACAEHLQLVGRR